MAWLPWTEWECYAAGMYDGKSIMPPDDAKAAYAAFLKDERRFELALDRVLAEWPKSCAHFLSKDHMNRIAWLGQAAMCIETGVSRDHRSGFMLMSCHQQERANAIAATALRKWEHGNKEVNRDLFADVA